MREASGDIWTYEPCDAILIPTNGEWRESASMPPTAIMGKGVALDCKRKIPGIDRHLGLYLKQQGNYPFVLCNLLRDGHNGKGPYIVSFPTKHSWLYPADFMLIIRSARRLAQIATENEWQNVVMPHVAAGLGRLSWDDVKRTIEPILDDRFVALDGTSK